MKLWRGRQNIYKMLELLSYFSPRWAWQGTAGGRVWKTWRTASMPASALLDSTKPTGTQCLHCGTWALTIRGSVTCVWKTLQAKECWCLDRSRWIPREVLGFVPQWRQRQLWPSFSTLFSCDLLRDIFPENLVGVTWWKFRPQGNGLFHSSCVMIKPVCALSLLGFSTAGRHYTVEEAWDNFL